MKQFWAVLRFELNGYFKNKIYLIMTALLVLIVVGVLSYPNLKSMLQEKSTESDTTVTQSETADDGDVIALVNQNEALDEDALAILTGMMSGKTLQLVQDDLQTVKDMVESGEYAGAIVIENGVSATYITRNESMTDTTSSLLYSAMVTAARYQALNALDVSDAEVQEILNPSVSISVEDLGASQTDTFFYTYVMLMALYMAIMIYGQIVATSVATEKSSRTMELLITSARPNSLLFGKMIAAALSGLFQIGAVFGSAVLLYHLNASAWEGNEVIASIFNMPPEIVAYVLLFFVLGFFLYAFMYGAIGSLVSRVEDVSSSSFPIILCFVAAFMIVVINVTSGSADSPLMILCSFIPLTSPMAMFARVAMASPAWYEIVISVGLLLATTIGVGMLSASIYRMGVLMYGKPPKPGEMLRVIRKARTHKE